MPEYNAVVDAADFPARAHNLINVFEMPYVNAHQRSTKPRIATSSAFGAKALSSAIQILNALNAYLDYDIRIDNNLNDEITDDGVIVPVLVLDDVRKVKFRNFGLTDADKRHA